MSPRALLFSSDEGTSRMLALALQELDLEVESCPEIFAAVEKLTQGNVALVIADCDMGPEASFLLKSAREMHSTVKAFRIALTDGNEAIIRDAGAQLVLRKPLLPQSTRSALMSCDDFTSRIHEWLPKDKLPELPTVAPELPTVVPARLAPPPRKEQPVVEETLPTAAEPLRGIETRESVAPSPRIETLFERELRSGSILSIGVPSTPRVRVAAKRGPGTIIRRVSLGIVFASSLYISISPARSEAVVVSVTKVYERAVEKTQNWLRRPDFQALDEAEIVQDVTQLRPAPERQPRIRVVPAPDPYAPPPAAPPNPSVVADAVSEPVPQKPIQPSPTTMARIPDSMRTPFEGASVRDVAVKMTPSLIGAMEPVTLSEDSARQLIVEKVLPSYPEQAMKAGLRGPVVLQASIGKDGRIEDLKLVRGYLALGQAATAAVRQWKFRPYVKNGQAVQAQILLTVDFNLP